MKKQLVNVTAVTMAGVMSVSALSSCSNMNDSTVTQAQGAGLFAAIGAGIGYVVVKLVGGSDRDAALVAATFGVIGASLGKEWGKSIVKRKAEYRSTEEYLDANIKQLDTRIGHVQGANKDLVKRINELKKNNQKGDKKQYEEINNNWKANKKLVDLDIKNARTAMKDAKGEDLTKLRSKLDTLQKERNAMSANIEALSRLSARG